MEHDGLPSLTGQETLSGMAARHRQLDSGKTLTC